MHRIGAHQESILMQRYTYQKHQYVNGENGWDLPPSVIQPGGVAKPLSTERTIRGHSSESELCRQYSLYCPSVGKGSWDGAGFLLWATVLALATSQSLPIFNWHFPFFIAFLSLCVFTSLCASAHVCKHEKAKGQFWSPSWLLFIFLVSLNLKPSQSTN